MESRHSPMGCESQDEQASTNRIQPLSFSTWQTDSSPHSSSHQVVPQNAIHMLNAIHFLLFICWCDYEKCLLRCKLIVARFIRRFSVLCLDSTESHWTEINFHLLYLVLFTPIPYWFLSFLHGACYHVIYTEWDHIKTGRVVLSTVIYLWNTKFLRVISVTPFEKGSTVSHRIHTD